MSLMERYLVGFMELKIELAQINTGVIGNTVRAEYLVDIPGA